MWAYYNDNDPFVCEWVRNLIKAGLVPDGEVDERSILDVQPDDVKGFQQCHFFCGILGWPLALQMAGWENDGRTVWTGSCPCQPLSGAGQRKGHADERHLWPAFYRLIAECAPTVVFGENVSGPLGREWLAAVRIDLEECGYAVGAADLCAAGVGAPHIRQRLFWVADGLSLGRGAGHDIPAGHQANGDRLAGLGGDGGELADTEHPVGRADGQPCRTEERELVHPRRQEGPAGPRIGREAGGLGDATGGEERRTRESRPSCGRQEPAGGSGAGPERVGHANGTGRPLGVRDARDDGAPCESTGGQAAEQAGAGDMGDPDRLGCEGADLPHQGRVVGGLAGAWDGAVLIPCADGKWRPAPDPESGLCVLAPRLPGHVGKLRGFGNAIVPQVAAVFIQAFMDTEEV